MNRRIFLRGAAAAAVVSGVAGKSLGTPTLRQANSESNDTTPGASKHPRAITMGEFSWIERRWPGALRTIVRPDSGAADQDPI